MKFCSCGQITDEKNPQCPGCEAHHVLGVGIDAAENEIRSAYHQLVKVWNPDNFQNDPKLKEAADGKLKNIQTAFDFLMSTSTERALQPRPTYLSSGNAPGGAALAASGQGTPDSTEHSDSSRLPLKINWNHKIFGWFLRIAGVVFVLLVGSMIWTAFNDQSRSNDQAAKVHTSDKPAPAKNSFWDALIEDLKKLVSRDTALESDQQAAQNTPHSNAGRQSKKSAAASQNKPAAAHVIKSYLTIGSTREEVLEQQGPPTASSEDKLVYGKSELYLKDGSVVGWRIDSVSSPIRVKLWPHSSVNPDLKSYTIGSSKDEVLVIQGTPTAFTDETFEYGRSIVYFHDNRVTHWKEDPASVTLWAR